MTAKTLRLHAGTGYSECGKHPEDFLSDPQEFQPFPVKGKLAANRDLSIPQVERLLLEAESHPVYSYVLTTVRRRGSGFAQSGSAPNFQGDLITLCTCKHLVRTAAPSPHAPDDHSVVTANTWTGVWIAGFAGLNASGASTNALFYLMQVSAAYVSHYDLWR